MDMIIGRDYDKADISELSMEEIDQVSGGHPAAVAAAAAIVTLGNSSLDFGRKLGATLYRVLH